MGFGFSSDVRLKCGWQFDLVFRTGRRETGELVRLFYVQAQEGAPLVGAAVGKKIANAVERARGRRMLRESFRRLLPWMKDGVWVVGSLREGALRASAQDVYFDLARSMERRGLMKDGWPGSDWEVDKAQGHVTSI
ncbi:ribonuclease P protein component [Synergistaceae bacterium OttesenSCG-928-D05]|nr:ribonuclease P protein component [Synergistaceae bacterium OttesenSCG-928-D05]